jgi:molybdopterin-guanine dinucleotide biosynthesis protein A
MGRPKLTLPFGDETMLARVVRVLGEMFHPIVVVAGPAQSVPALPADVQILRDEQEFLGPLAGMGIGLRFLRNVVSAAFVSSCDVPLLRTEFVRAVVKKLGTHELAVPFDGVFHQPLSAVYRTSLSDRVEQLVAERRLRTLDLIQKSDAVEISVDELRLADPALHSLQNVNCWEDYESALRIAGLA